MEKFITIKDACNLVGKSRRTIERKIGSGEIKSQEVGMIDRVRYVDEAAIRRVFGNQPNSEEVPASEPAKSLKQAPESSEGDLVRFLREQLAKAEEREGIATGRAERLDCELSEARNRIDALTNGLVGHLHALQVQKSKPKGFLASWIGRIRGDG